MRQALSRPATDESLAQDETRKGLAQPQHNIMKIITDSTEIVIANNKATKHEGAFATCRVIDHEAPDCQEWAEYCEIDGAPAKIYYIFENDECEVEELDEMPWDSNHISKIKIAEKDEDGEFERL